MPTATETGYKASPRQTTGTLAGMVAGWRSERVAPIPHKAEQQVKPAADHDREVKPDRREADPGKDPHQVDLSVHTLKEQVGTVLWQICFGTLGPNAETAPAQLGWLR